MTGVINIMSGSEIEQLKFKIRILIRHPTADPIEITNKLGTDPDNFQKVGEIRKTPRGKAVGGINEYSMWSKSFFFEKERNFFHRASSVIDLFEGNKDFIVNLIDSGGSIQLITDLSGQLNIGDVFSWKDLGRLADLKIDLGVEVFPEF